MTTSVVRERDRLAELEGVIGRGLQTFVEVGQALAEIQATKLYRYEFKTFAEYCDQRWNLSRRYAYNLIEAAEVCAQLRTPPATEAQARELAPLLDEPKELKAAWQEAASDGKPTSRKVREAVTRRLPEKPEPEYDYCPMCGAKFKKGAERPISRRRPRTSAAEEASAREASGVEPARSA